MSRSNISVFQRGGNYLHRRLTKLYSDTKQSYETASVASKTTADEDPVLKALHREFRIQKDRLLAWGLQWSDSNAAPSPDVEIDQKLDQAGLGHVVALVMSDIQKLLIESEKMQNPQTSFQEKMPGGQLDSKALPGSNELTTTDNIAKSQSLLSQLITCIDSLYKLSESRRTLSGGSNIEKGSKESLTKDHPSPTSPSGSPVQDQCGALRAAGLTCQTEQSIRQDKLFIDPSYITRVFDVTVVSLKPPPYEEVMPLEKTRVPGKLLVPRLTVEQRSAFGLEDNSQKAVIVEYVPTMRHEGSALDDQYCSALRYARQISESQFSVQVSHTGNLRLLGYTIDIRNTRHGFVYQMPTREASSDQQSRVPVISNLRAIIPSKRDDTDQPSPHLEDRFRLAFNILLSMLHSSVLGLRHECLNSANIVILLDHHIEQDNSGRSGISSFDIRRPYLLQSPPSDHMPKQADGLSSGIYRHAHDNDVNGLERSWAFDIYSFGLILLEIGLWTPVSRLWKSKYNKFTFASRIKNIYVPKLTSRCGTAYMKVVQTCINAPDLFEARSGSTGTVETAQFWCSYMIQIGRNLSRCCAIDVDGPPCEPDLAYFEHLNDKQPSLEFPRTLERKGSTFKPTRHVTQFEAATDATLQIEKRPEPQAQSAVQHTILKKWNNVDIPQDCLDQWNTYLMPRISKLLQKALSSSHESCSASLMMVGKTPETAKTTICIQCMSVEKVRECLKRNFRCKKGWGLVVLKGDVRRSGKPRRKGKCHDSARSRLQPPQPEKSAYQAKPQFGASIGAFRNNEHLPPVSFGGAILVDGKPYGMTVHHMLDAPSDDEEEMPTDGEDGVQRSSAKSSDAWLSDMSANQSREHFRQELLEGSDILEISDDESECSTIRPDYINLETGNGGFWFADDGDETPGLEDDFESDSDEEDSSDIGDDDDDDDRASVGDTLGIDPADDEEVYVTQPAIDDVDDDFFPCIEDRDEDHLASHSLGYVHASSGIRRVVTGNLKHEIDWALIKIRDERLAVGNTIHQHITKSKKYRKTKGKPSAAPSSTLNPSVTQLTTIAPSSTLARLPVQCHGRTSGLQSGRISAALALVKLHGRTSFSSSWVVEGGAFGVPGDSGAWIYDPQTGRLCGHVLAWGRQSKTAYMAPMDLLFEDIRKRLAADRVELPGSGGLGCAASRQLEKSQVDLLQDQKQRLGIPASAGMMDEDVEMKLDDDTPGPAAKPLELAMGDLQIGGKVSAQLNNNSIALSTKTKDIPNSLTCQVQGRQQGLQKVMGDRVLGSRVA
ncbi:hypothetical protein EPUS_01795 [Endocarpon pusillum Z07020]|uniref:Protein kinase domain-containing protein n=1 Tax=Endocarpon pusillum (strain Z07020 / HMAS-L-300199) TaxID=1263415 RepID=U1HNE5_ENDPU|nr:uncharacterized protein EPUS_01795 [Endocarpon pusillum Z07020]ERF71880.1 hypothetical protein EPUS_01795 [Endocarpon pusillum Z07020]